MTTNSPQRVGCYVDGFNLYYGLRDSNFKKFLWLDIHRLAGLLLLPQQTLAYSKYFTARISGGKPTDKPTYRQTRDAKRKRQANYLEALAATSDVQIFEGQFLDKTIKCAKCGATWSSAEEKMTDVNIATELLVDAFANRFDTAIVISADSDLVPPILAVKKCHPHKRVVVAFPPSRSSLNLRKAAQIYFIGRGHLKESQMPEQITTRTGFVLKRPATWV